MAIAVLGYGLHWPLLRYGMQDLPALWFGFWRLLASVPAVFLLLILIGKFRMPSRQDIPAIVSVGIFMPGLFVVLTHFGLVFVGAGRASLLAYTTPLWVAPIAALFLGERIGKLKLIGVTIGVAGLVILFNPGGFDWSDRDVVIGNAVLLLAALSWSLCIIQLRSHKYRLSTLQLLPWQLCLSTVVALIAAALVEPDVAMPRTAHAVWIVLIAGPVFVFPTILPANAAVRLLPAVTASVGFLGVPVVATVTALLWLGEPVTATLFAGLAVVLIGVALVSAGDARLESRKSGNNDREATHGGA